MLLLLLLYVWLPYTLVPVCTAASNPPRFICSSCLTAMMRVERRHACHCVRLGYECCAQSTVLLLGSQSSMPDCLFPSPTTIVIPAADVHVPRPIPSSGHLPAILSCYTLPLSPSSVALYLP
ncbi:hypothetical protein M440DRAFT_1400891 [Trichoderma longibrachiatum ATCC 18648]|uniref:Secreted protein n=1 Tax=Trichoderma longibrachiatum ATCC 18648 TaxID=983965 RepID=A0A2T4C8V1_TRILO|nr:hypothetical protein M440DRAFT_1400891 [Trichoderma longibrachiatum ATCC 18648]